MSLVRWPTLPEPFTTGDSFILLVPKCMLPFLEPTFSVTLMCRSHTVTFCSIELPMLLPRYTPVSGIAASYSNSVFNILRKLTAAIPLYIPNSSAFGFRFLHILPTCVIAVFFYHSHPGRYKDVSHCGFYLNFSNN